MYRPPSPIGLGRPPRLQDFDYTSCNAYFVTIVTRDRAEVLGSVRDGVVSLSPAGREALAAWEDLPRRFPFIRLDGFVVMPNHIHGILSFEAPGDVPPGDPSPVPLTRKHLDIVVQAFKSISTIAVNRALGHAGVPLWQRGYFEHVVRDDRALGRIQAYIIGNPAAWAGDRYNEARRG